MHRHKGLIVFDFAINGRDDVIDDVSTICLFAINPSKKFIMSDTAYDYGSSSTYDYSSATDIVIYTIVPSIIVLIVVVGCVLTAVRRRRMIQSMATAPMMMQPCQIPSGQWVMVPMPPGTPIQPGMQMQYMYPQGMNPGYAGTPMAMGSSPQFQNGLPPYGQPIYAPVGTPATTPMQYGVPGEVTPSPFSVGKNDL